MNQPDADYWLAVAAQWIQSKSQTQMNFPFHSPFSQLPQNVPEAPKISTIDATINDNLVEADMDIEEDVKEEEAPPQIWANWQNSEPQPTIQTSHQPRPAVRNTFVPKHHPAKRQNNRAEPFNSLKNVQVPVAPMIGQLTESSFSEDMVLDSDEDDNDNISASVLEAQKRKKLPVWIREGLERIEREKKLEEQRLLKEKEDQQNEENRKKLMEEALKELEREKVSKSKYDTESEDDEEPQRDDTPETDPYPLPKRPATVQDEEDAFEKMMLLVRKTLTEVLLEVTDEKIQEISSETLSKYRKKASSVTSNRTVTNSLGLGVYADSSDDDSEAEDAEKPETEQSDWEPESVLKERIRVKSIAFEHKAKEIKERLARIAEAEERFSKRASEVQEHAKYDSDSDKLQKSKSRKNDGEEKYEQIYSVSSSYASNSRQRDKKKTRFNDPKERTSSILLTHVHVGMLDSSKTGGDNGSSLVAPIPQLPMSIRKEKSKKRDVSSSSSSSSDRQKKHKKHKKSSKHSKKSSRKRDRSRDYDRDKYKSYTSDRRSMESKSSVRSSESRRRSRSRSRSRDRRRSRKY